MRLAALPSTWLLGAALAACASSPRAPAPSPSTPAPAADPAPAPPAESEPAPVTVDTPERSQPPSTASYEQAMATPEQLDVHDDRPHLDDDQLRGPMRAVPAKCALPANAKVTIHTAVQGGRAIGVTVDVRFEHAKPAKPSKKRPSRAAAQRAAAAAQREAKAKQKIATCIDHAVRALTWPPSHRRDSFTSEL